MAGFCRVGRFLGFHLSLSLTSLSLFMKFCSFHLSSCHLHPRFFLEVILEPPLTEERGRWAWGWRFSVWQHYAAQKVPRSDEAEGRKESLAISYESDFLPSVKNSRCGIVTHAAADMGSRAGGHSHGESVNSLHVSPENTHEKEQD